MSTAIANHYQVLKQQILTHDLDGFLATLRSAPSDILLTRTQDPLLILALKERQNLMAQALLQNAACDTHVRDEAGNTPLILAVQSRCPDLAAIFVSHKPLVNAFNHAGLTAIHLAVQMGLTAQVLDLIQMGANLNQGVYQASDRDCHACTPLMMAVHRQDLALIALLLDFGASVNQTNQRGENALILATRLGFGPGVGLLVSRGAHILQMDKDKQTAIDYCQALAQTGQLPFERLSEVLVQRAYVKLELKKPTLWQRILESFTAAISDLFQITDKRFKPQLLDHELSFKILSLGRTTSTRLWHERFNTLKHAFQVPITETAGPDLSKIALNKLQAQNKKPTLNTSSHLHSTIKAAFKSLKQPPA